jgi:hypothetical protein
LQVLADEALRRFQAEAIQKAAVFDIKYQAEKLLSVYEQAIEDKAAGRSVVVDRDLLKDSRDQLGLSLSTS